MQAGILISVHGWRLACWVATMRLRYCCLLNQAVLRGVLKPASGSLNIDSCPSVAVGLLRLHLFPEAGILKEVISVQRLARWVDVLGEKACIQL